VRVVTLRTARHYIVHTPTITTQDIQLTSSLFLGFSTRFSITTVTYSAKASSVRVRRRSRQEGLHAVVQVGCVLVAGSLQSLVQHCHHQE
jgi:hypothetical protein